MAAASSPSLTVIIPAYFRRNFLLQAVGSVLEQPSPVGELEILVIKNFEDEGIDQALVRGGVRTLDFGSQTYGLTLARAVRAAHGDVVAFLEDDDRFARTKLQTLREVFGRSSEVGFYHNDYLEIDAIGKPRARSELRQSLDRRVAGEGLRVFGAREKREQFDRLTAFLPHAHLSCMAVRRTLLEAVTPQLERVPIGVDFFLFFAALASPGEMVIDPRPLTEYRIHPGNSSRQLTTSEERHAELERDSEAMTVEARGLLRARGATSLEPLLESELAAHEMFLAWSAPRPDSWALAAALAGMVRHPRSLRGPGRMRLFLRGLSRFVSFGRAFSHRPTQD
jgi:glycosyltransferase involved in cell wall biosynthesis